MVNRLDRRSDITPEDMEKIFRASVHATFPNDPSAVQRALPEGTSVAENSERGKSLQRFVSGVVGVRQKPSEQGIGTRKRLLGRA